MKIRKLKLWILAGDLLWIGLAMVGAAVLRYGSASPLGWRASLALLLPFLVSSCAVWMILSSSMELDGFRGGWRFAAVVSHVFVAVVFMMGALLALAYLARHYVSRLALSYFGILLLVGFIGIRYSAYLFLRARYNAGDVWRVVILGTGRVARELATKIYRHPEMLCRVIGLLFPENSAGEDCDFVRTNNARSLQVSTFGIMDLLCANKVNEIILALPQPALAEIRQLTAQCQERGIRVSLIPQPYELYLSRPKLLDLDGLPVLQFREARSSPLFLRLKRLFDLGLGTLLAVTAAPLVLVMALGLRLKKGKAFRWELRCGQHGKPFLMLRLNVDRHTVDAPAFETVLARLSVSELPQLLNVLRGEMTLVGPRPESPVRVKRYSEWQQQRLAVTPGMTGLAQVHGLREQNSSEEKARFDLQYVMNASLLSDISLLLQTIWTLVMRIVHYYDLIPSENDRPAAPVSLAEVPLAEVFSAHRTQSSTD
jgi:lipopolysaccharide/colanic/teichoic acid biosynthesis glycosyltransferase